MMLIDDSLATIEAAVELYSKDCCYFDEDVQQAMIDDAYDLLDAFIKSGVVNVNEYDNAISKINKLEAEIRTLKSERASQ